MCAQVVCMWSRQRGINCMLPNGNMAIAGDDEKFDQRFLANICMRLYFYIIKLLESAKDLPTLTLGTARGYMNVQSSNTNVIDKRRSLSRKWAMRRNVEPITMVKAWNTDTHHAGMCQRIHNASCYSTVHLSVTVQCHITVLCSWKYIPVKINCAPSVLRRCTKQFQGIQSAWLWMPTKQRQWRHQEY